MSQHELSPEIYKQTLEFLRIANRAAKRAQEENRKKGIPNVYFFNGHIYYQLPNGELTPEDPFMKEKDNLAKRVSKILPLTKKLLDQSRDILGKLDIVKELDKSAPSMEDMYLIFLHIYTKLALSFAYGAYYSCNHGWGISGVGAARSIYEIFVTIEYIKKHRDERLERFIRGSIAASRQNDMETAILHEMPISQDRKKEIGNAYKQVKQKYENATPVYEKHKWAGISIEEMAARIDWKESHKLVYGQLSKISHVSASLMDQHINMEGNKIHIDSKLQESNEYCEEVLSVVFGYISLILDEFMRAFKIKCPASLEKIQKDYIKVSQSLSNEQPEEAAN